MTLKALVIKAPENKPSFDASDVIMIARAVSKKVFHVEKVQIKDLIMKPYGWIAVVEVPNGCTKPQGCKGLKGRR